MADEAGGVDRRRGAVERREVVGEPAIAVIGGIADQVERRRGRPVDRQWRQADPAIAGDDGGDALARLRHHLRCGEQRAVVVGVHIDKARRDNLARHVHLARAGRLSNRADLGNPIVGNRDIGAKPRPPAAIDDLAAAQNVIGHFFPRSDDRALGASFASKPDPLQDIVLRRFPG